MPPRRKGSQPRKARAPAPAGAPGRRHRLRAPRQSRAHPFEALHAEGVLLPLELCARVAERDGSLGGLAEGDYHLVGERLNEAIERGWSRLAAAWASFARERDALGENQPGTAIARERFLLPLFDALGYGRLQRVAPLDIEGKSYPVSHAWHHVPIHLVGANVDLDHKSPGVEGAATASPHALVQEALNRSPDALWGFVSNGRRLRILRDDASLTRQCYLEVDLEAIFTGQRYAEWAVLWLLAHVSRLESPPGRASECWLERWSRESERRGTRALDALRRGVTSAIETLGQGFLAHPRNEPLRDALRSGALDRHDLYRALLHLVYRLLFLFVAEDRDLLLLPADGTDERAAARERYRRWYATARLRARAARRGGGAHGDLWEALRIVMGGLGRDGGLPALALPALGSFLWEPGALGRLATSGLGNDALLDAVRALAYTEDARVRRPIDFRTLGAEELGSVYESLLELHPEVSRRGDVHPARGRR